MNADHPRLLEFYRSGAEGVRLTRRHGQLELVRMKELLDQFLPKPPSRIIDIGGATGVYSSWLASLGHIVHLVDVVPGHVKEASGDGRFTASVADARALPVSDESYDVALLLGPLYHLPKLADRLQAVREACRVVREHGMIAAAFVCRAAAVWMDS